MGLILWGMIEVRNGSSSHAGDGGNRKVWISDGRRALTETP